MQVSFVSPQNVKALLPSAVQSALATGDVLYWNGTDFTRLAAGATSGHVLTSNGSGAAPSWQAAAGGGGGMTDPTTTKGDLIVHGTTTDRLPVGSNGTALLADSTQTLGVAWVGVPVLAPAATQTIQVAGTATNVDALRLNANSGQSSVGDQSAIEPLLDVVGGGVRIKGPTYSTTGATSSAFRISTRPVTGITVPLIYPEAVGGFALDLSPRSSSPGTAGSQAGLSNQSGGLIWIDMGMTDYINGGANYRSLRTATWLDGHASIGIVDATSGISSPVNTLVMHGVNWLLGATNANDTITSGWAHEIRVGGTVQGVRANNTNQANYWKIGDGASTLGTHGASLYCFGSGIGFSPMTQSVGVMFEHTQGGLWCPTDSAAEIDVVFGASAANRKVRLMSTGSVVVGKGSALATNATDGFVYIQSMAGTPSGTPTAFTGSVPMVYDTSADKLWIHNGSAWKSVALT